jgi:thiamine phosphate synthase YjbQ (UPF0047 family)
MEYLVKNEKLILKCVPNKGAWTYRIEIPNTPHIVRKWGFLKPSGTIDDYKLEDKNLFTIKGQNKLISVNEEIRKAINKTGGDTVIVTLYLSATKEQITENQILESFKESDVLEKFQKLKVREKSKIITKIHSQKTEETQIKAIIKYIDYLAN